MNYFLAIYNWYTNLTLKHKIGLFLASTAIGILTLGLIFWACTPEYAVLFNQLDEQDASQIISQLEQQQISYQLHNNGQDILVDKALIAKLRLTIMGSGMHFKGNVGFELFDKSDFGMTDFSQKINYQRALQGELERTISQFEEIKQARVHLVMPEQHLFAEEKNLPKAAVTLDLKRPLTLKQVQSIQQLITASVAHLTKTNVVIIDDQGNTLSTTDEDPITNQFASKKTIEQYLTDKTKQLLQHIVPKNQFVVGIDVSMNYDELERELITPQNHGQVTHEKQIQHYTPEKTNKDKKAQDSTLEKTYQLGTEKELFKRANGTIDRLSVSIVIPQDTKEARRKQITLLVKNAVGFSEKRGDSISVEALLLPIAPPKVHTSQDSPMLKSAPQSQQLFYFLLPLFLIIAAGTITLKKIRLKKRQLLLLELTQWLNHHG